MKNNFFAILLSLIISIGCTQETVINANIDEKLNNSGPTLKVQIKTENSRTIRPEVTKWEIKLFELNGTNEEILATRVLHGKDNTVTTFTNVTVGNYTVKVTGKSEDDGNILFGEEDVIVEANKVNIYNIKMKDCLENDETTGNGSLNVSISVLDDLFTADETINLIYKKLSESDNGTPFQLKYENGKLSGKKDSIPAGSYKIEIPNEKVNLVKDPIVNIYPDTTTYINWTWNYDSTQIDADKILKDVKVSVWNKPVDNRRAESSVPAKNGSLSANALFAEPTWDEGQCSFEYKSDDGSTISATVNKDELEFINCTYDESDDLWVLSGTSEMNVFFDDNNSPLVQEYYCYVLRNLSASETKEYKFTCSSRLSQDFAVATVGEQNDQNKQKYLFYITGDGYNIKSFKFRDEDNWNIDDGTPYYGENQYITAIYAKDNNLYIAISDIESETGSRFIKILKTELAADGSGNIIEYEDDGSEVLKLDINSFIEVEDGYSFQSPAFAISDMYINEDKTKLYVTAGCVCYQIKAWIFNENDYWGPHSFGGLFVYKLEESGNLAKDVDGSITVESYGINQDEDENNPFLKEAKPGEGIFELESNIMQAENEDSRYFAGPRYIIPAGKDLLIVDSGFYGNLDEDEYSFIDCEKRNRIFTFDGSTLSAPIKLSDSISFDYDYLVNSDKIE